MALSAYLWHFFCEWKQMTLSMLEFGNTVFAFVFLFCTLRIAVDFREWTVLTLVLSGR